MKNTFWKRVDFQVSIFTAAIVAALTFSIFIFQYQITYRDTLKSLNDQVESIYSYIDEFLDTTTFDNISVREDINNPEYIEMHDLFRQVKEVTGVMYLYTAKQNSNGEFIYVIDGLNSDNPSFRYPGDLIESEIYPDMQRALSGEKVLPDKIKDTEWGKIFITYLPIYDDADVIGVIGIEFEAEHQYMTYRNLRLLLPWFILLFSLIASLISRALFRHISNPFYRDMANTDYLTQLKNRNAYQIDMANLIAMRREHGMGIIAIDLNSLKKVNDTYGHEKGDQYITCISQAFENLKTKEAVMYRIGGDEFVIWVPGADESKIENLMARLKEEFYKLTFSPDLSFSWGYAIYNEQEDDDLHSTYRKADKQMYSKKQEHYSALENNTDKNR